MKTALSKLFACLKTSPRRPVSTCRDRRVRLQVEGLETRQLMSATNPINPDGLHTPALVQTAQTSAHLSFVSQPPATVQSGSLFGTSLQVLNQNGRPLAGVPVTLHISSGTLGGTTTVTTNAAGLAVFSNLSVTVAGIDTLQASAPGLAGVSSTSFTVAGNNPVQGLRAQLSPANHFPPADPRTHLVSAVIDIVNSLPSDRFGPFRLAFHLPPGFSLVGSSGVINGNPVFVVNQTVPATTHGLGSGVPNGTLRIVVTLRVPNNFVGNAPIGQIDVFQ
jgi:hypothetical protein